MWRRWTAHNLQCTLLSSIFTFKGNYNKNYAEESIKLSSLSKEVSRAFPLLLLNFILKKESILIENDLKTHFPRKILMSQMLVKVKHFKNVIESKNPFHFQLFWLCSSSRFAPKNYPQNVMRKCHIWNLRLNWTYL